MVSQKSLRDQTLAQAGIDLSTLISLAENIPVFKIPGGETASRIWHKLSQNPLLEVSPILIGDAENLDRVRQCVLDFPPNPHLSLPEFPLRDLIRSKLESGPTPPTDDDFSPPPMPPNLKTWAKSAKPNKNSLLTPFNLHDQTPLHDCHIALVPCDPFEVPAFLSFGGFNECPQPLQHVAILKDWNTRFGAIPAALTGDALELFIPNPPKTIEETFHIAWEQSLYCDDLLSHGPTALEKLARQLWLSNYWHFWWD